MKRNTEASAHAGDIDDGATDQPLPADGEEDLTVLRGENDAVEISVPVQVFAKIGSELVDILAGLVETLEYHQLKIGLRTNGAPTREAFIGMIETLRLVRENTRRGFTIGLSQDLLEQLFNRGMSVDEFGAIMARNFNSREVN